MCRFALYLGPKLRMSALVTEPDHSIIRQSFHSEERDEPLNGDGFGVAWYNQDLSDRPGVFKDVSPAWNNQNLINLSRMIESECMLAHVRAATGGLPVTELNCHPFSWRQFSFMHNGKIAGFNQMRRKLSNHFSDEVYEKVLGSTDSEHAFGAFIDHYQSLVSREQVGHLEAMVQGIRQTILDIEAYRKETKSVEASLLNFLITDGKNTVISRFSSSEETEANTLYTFQGSRYTCENGVCHIHDDAGKQVVLVASEPLTKEVGWQIVEANTLVVIDEHRNISYEKILY